MARRVSLSSLIQYRIFSANSLAPNMPVNCDNHPVGLLEQRGLKTKSICNNLSQTSPS